MLRVILFLIIICFVAGPSSTRASVFQLTASKYDIKSKLLGQWKVISKVVWSDCDYVAEGSEAESEIVFKSMHGKLYPEWRAEGWNLVRDNAVDFFYDDSLHWERESKLEKNGEYWFVKTINDFNFDEHGRLVGISHVKQYLNGEFVGSYITESELISAHNS